VPDYDCRVPANNKVSSRLLATWYTVLQSLCQRDYSSIVLYPTRVSQRRAPIRMRDRSSRLDIIWPRKCFESDFGSDYWEVLTASHVAYHNIIIGPFCRFMRGGRFIDSFLRRFTGIIPGILYDV